jgi:UDP-glucose 4-epimerase
VVGTAAPELIDNSVENLVPIVINKLRVGEAPVIYGLDYPTPDGTCIRDYVDVRDVAKAHLCAANAGKELPLAINVGTGKGASVREVIDLVGATFGQENLNIMNSERRAGDSAVLCADVSLIETTLDFRASFSLIDSVRSLFQ